MDLLNNLISNHSSELISTLTDSGFNTEQAQNFLPEAGRGVTEALSGGNLSELLTGDTNALMSTILEKVDVAGIASRLGIDESMVNEGLSALVPKVMEIFQGEGGGLASLLGGEGAGGLLGGLAKLGEKFFNK